MSSPATAAHRETSPEQTPARSLSAIFIEIILAGIYLSALWFTFTEAGRRSVSLEIPAQGRDYLFIHATVVHVDLLRSEMTTRISFQLAGALAQDESTPALDLHLLLNAVRGQQEFDFPKGSRMNTIEAVFPLQGEVNLYPFDSHNGVLWFLVTIPGRKNDSQHTVPEELAKSPGLPIAASSLGKRMQADTKTLFTASIAGITFRGSRSIQSAEALKGLTGIEVRLSRSTNVVFISITSMAMMAAIAVGLASMVVKIVAGRRRMANFHVPMAVSLMFGLPALRNIQPGVPPPGTFGDSVAFTWAEVAAAGSAIALVLHWLSNRTADRTAAAEKQ